MIDDVRECIITVLTVRGTGTEEDPIRRTTEVWVRNADGGFDKIAYPFEKGKE